MTISATKAARGFARLLADAGSQVYEPWFLPTARPDAPSRPYRERVYCYELYHQLRTAMSNAREDLAPTPGYLLSGEMDKAGLHSVLQDGRHKPDLIWHVPGEDRYNATVVEVKSAPPDKDGLKKDIETLAAFVTAPKRAYARGIVLVFGDIEVDALKALTAEAGRLAELPLSARNAVSPAWRSRVELWHHRRPGTDLDVEKPLDHRPRRICSLAVLNPSGFDS